jgi:hypothetical protein
MVHESVQYKMLCIIASNKHAPYHHIIYNLYRKGFKTELIVLFVATIRS